MQDFFILVFDKPDTVKPTDSEIARDHFFPLLWGFTIRRLFSTIRFVFHGRIMKSEFAVVNASC